MPGSVSAAALTNLTLAEAGDGGSWDDLGGGQGSNQSSDLPIQGAETRARRIDNGIRGFGYDAGTGQNLSTVGTHVGFWANVLQPGQIGTTQGLQFSLSDSATGSQSGNWDGHNFVAANYPNTGGWQRVWIDVTRTRDAGAGTLSTANIRGFGCEFDIGDVGGNAPNCHLDRIDHTATGLTLTAGTTGSPATFDDVETSDTASAFGIFNGSVLSGPLRIGGAATVFRENNFAISAGNQPLAASDWVRIDWEASNGGEDIQIEGFGFFDGVYHTFTGGAGVIDLSGAVISASPLAMTLSAAVTWGGSLVSSPTLTQNGANLNGLSISGGTDIVGAVIDDTGLFVGGSVTNCDRGIELVGAGPFTVDGVSFSANTVDIRVNSAGDVDVNLVNGADALTAENIGAGGVNLLNSVLVELIELVPNSSILIFNVTDNQELFRLVEPTDTFSGSVNFTGDIELLIRVRNHSTSPFYQDFRATGTLTSSGFSLTVNQILDE